MGTKREYENGLVGSRVGRGGKVLSLVLVCFFDFWLEYLVDI